MFRCRSSTVTRLWSHLELSRLAPIISSACRTCQTYTYTSGLINTPPYRYISQYVKQQQRKKAALRSLPSISASDASESEVDEDEDEYSNSDMDEEKDEEEEYEDDPRAGDTGNSMSPEERSHWQDVATRVGPDAKLCGNLVGGAKITDHDLEFFENDLDESFIKGWGRGGQKVNKTSNCVRLLHVPTGTQVKCHATRDLQQNRMIARKIMRERLQLLRLGPSSRHALEGERQRKKKERLQRRRRSKLEAEIDAKATQQAEDMADQYMDAMDRDPVTHRKLFAFEKHKKPAHQQILHNLHIESSHDMNNSNAQPLSSSSSSSSSSASSPSPTSPDTMASNSRVDPLSELEGRRASRVEAQALKREERARKREQRWAIKEHKEQIRELEKERRREEREARKAAAAARRRNEDDDD